MIAIFFLRKEGRKMDKCEMKMEMMMNQKKKRKTKEKRRARIIKCLGLGTIGKGRERYPEIVRSWLQLRAGCRFAPYSCGGSWMCARLVPDPICVVVVWETRRERRGRRNGKSLKKMNGAL